MCLPVEPGDGRQQQPAGSLSRVRLIRTEVSFRPVSEGFRGTDRELLQADALFLGPMA